MHQHNAKNDGIDRRTVAKGAAWSLPVLAAAVAAPHAAASVVPPECPECFTAGGLDTPFTAQAVVLGNEGAMTLATTLNVSTESCADLSLFQPAYTAVMTGATLTMSDGNVYNTTLGLGTGVGTFGTISAFAFAGEFLGVDMPNGGSLGNYNPRPTQLCVEFEMIVVGLPSLIEIRCPVTICWDITCLGTGAVLLGAGTINYTGLMNP